MLPTVWVWQKVGHVINVHYSGIDFAQFSIVVQSPTICCPEIRGVCYLGAVNVLLIYL